MKVAADFRLLAARLVALLLAASMPGSAVHAQEAAANYPSRPIRIIVPYPPGGAVDPVARAIAQRLLAAWSQPVIVDNRPGGNTFIAAEATARAPADGYTLLVAAVGTLAVNPALYAKLPYDVSRDYAPIAKLADLPLILVVPPNSPIHSVKELVDQARANPGKLTFASGGTGQGTHLAGELFKAMAGVSMVHVPYKGNAPAVLDVMAGRVDMIFDGMAASLSNVKAGKLRALAVTTPRRSAAMPELPTVAEAALPGFDVGSWFGLLAPAGTPEPIINKLNEAVVRILREPEMITMMTGLGLEPAPSTPDEFARYIRNESAKWSQVIKDANIKAEQ